MSDDVVIAEQREISCIDEHRRFLDHILAKCSMPDRPGLDVRAVFWPETLAITYEKPSCVAEAFLAQCISFDLTVHG